MSQTTPYWFYETALPYGRPGIKIGVEVTEKIYEGDSDYSHIEVLQTPFYGKMLVIDGIIQTTEYDESIYHEMMITAACVQHGNPKSLLIIGGGDGGAAKQALRNTSLEKIVMVEIDQGVIDASEKFMPFISEGALRGVDRWRRIRIFKKFK
jgi:spermidine synthase